MRTVTKDKNAFIDGLEIDIRGIIYTQRLKHI